MSLVSQLGSFITALGADIKKLNDRETFLTYSIAGSQVVNIGLLQMPILSGTYTIKGVTARLATAPTGGTTFKVDVNKNGSTIFSTQANRPIFTASQNKADSGTPDTTSVTTGDYLTVDVDAVGSTVAGSDLTVTVRLQRTGI